MLNPSLQYCDKENIRRSSMHSRMLDLSLFGLKVHVFQRNSHAGSGKSINEDNILPSMHEASSSPCPIRRGYFSEMLFPTWLKVPKLMPPDPNKDKDEMHGFEDIFRWREHSIWATKRLKVRRKCTLKRCLPKSSFGEHGV